MDIRLRGIGAVSLPELEARFSAYLNAGAPEPVLEGDAAERKQILAAVAARGDAQMKSFLDAALREGGE